MLRSLSNKAPFSQLEENYFQVRQKEGRILADEEVILLPQVRPGNPYQKEWKVRTISLNIIVNYLRSHQNQSSAKLLEIGCGNGWLCNRLFQAGFDVSGLDVNTRELEQAARLFPSIPFYYADVFHAPELGKYDVILLVASLQYFSDPQKLIQHLKQNHLNQSGRIIIGDTLFYTQNQKDAAKKRTLNYYTSLGFPEMAEFYFHHNKDFLREFSFTTLKKNTIFEKIGAFFKKEKHPFDIFVIH